MKPNGQIKFQISQENVNRPGMAITWSQEEFKSNDSIGSNIFSNRPKQTLRIFLVYETHYSLVDFKVNMMYNAPTGSEIDCQGYYVWFSLKTDELCTQQIW